MKYNSLENQLKDIIQESLWFMQVLYTARDMNFSSWCIGAGAIRNLVWDHLHHYSQASYLSDVDLAYFDPNEGINVEHEHQAVISQKLPHIPWEVTNQAYVHYWFEEYFGHAVAPITSLESAVATWPEYTTSIGVFLTSQDQIQIIAPYGLEDLFSMYVRRNPKRVTIETYRQRILSKRYHERWPKVTIFPE